jgi:hypothetical protein
MTAAHQLEVSFDQAASHLALALPIGQRRMQGPTDSIIYIHLRMYVLFRQTRVTGQ